MKIKSIGFIVLFFILTGCEDNGKTIRAETLSTLSFILKDSCRDYVSKEAESRGLEVSYKEIHNPHPLYRKINLSGVLTYKYYNEATDFIDHINEKCFGSSFSLIVLSVCPLDFCYDISRLIWLRNSQINLVFLLALKRLLSVLHF